MMTRDIVETAWQSLRAHRLRTGLSVLGIVIGIASFSIMYSVGEAARQKTIQALKELGGDILRVSTKADKDRPNREEISLNLKDLATIQATCPNVLDVSPEFTNNAEFFRAGKFQSFNVIGVLPIYFSMNKIQVARGHLISDHDLQYYLPVCLLGEELAVELFPEKEALGQMVPINGYLLKVVGIMKKTERLAAEDINRAALIPITLAQRLFPTKKIRTIYARGKDTNISTAELSQFFYRRFGEEQRFEIQSQKLILETQQKSIKIFEYVLWTIGSISLLVGGIGIMNIMLVSVTERVREIGIRRAVGATKWDIKIQFMFESILLCLLGGLGGATLGFLASRLISRSFQFSPVFSGKLLLLAISIATVLGIVCGTYPAVRAANQDPTIVLRYE